MRRVMTAIEPESAFVPAVEVTSRDGQYIVRADLPGMRPEDVKVEIADDAIVLEGERKCEVTDDGGTRSERLYGRFYRSIPLPDGAKSEEAQARFDNGVLEISVPVSGPRSRQIPIETTSAGSNQTTDDNQTSQTTKKRS
jgi:HSP20 family protein